MTENIRVFTQNSIRINGNGKTIYIDTFKMTEKPNDADYILITHDHFDHFSPEDIAKVSKSDTVLVVPANMADKAEQVADIVGKIVTVKPNSSYNIDGLEIETIPAYNRLKPFHPKGAGWVGYILNVDGKRIYVAGDTDATKEAGKVQCDIALIPIGGTYTMDAKQAAELINTIKPEVVIPTHYGSVVGKPDDADVFARLVKEPVKVEISII